MTTSPTAHQRPKAPTRAWLPVVVTALVIGCSFVALFIGLQRSPSPAGVPLAVSGSELAESVERAGGGGVDVAAVSSTTEGEALVKKGRAVAVLSTERAGVLTLQYAEAAGRTETAVALEIGSRVAEGAGARLEPADLVPLKRYDRSGLSTFYLVFGVTLASFILAQGLASSASLVSVRRRIVIKLGFALVIGVLAASIAGPLYSSLAPSFAQMAPALVLLSAACAFITAALAAWLGPPGIGLAVLLLTVVGNAVSGATIGEDLLPRWAQVISAETPQGAAVRLLNGLGYFRGTDVARPIVVLGLWFLAGLALLLLREALVAHRSGASPQAKHVAHSRPSSTD